jgi:excisionase family DNA binding protein
MESPQRDRHIPDLVSLTEAAELLGVSRAAVHKMIGKGQLVGAQVGTTWVFRRAVVERHVQE